MVPFCCNWPGEPVLVVVTGLRWTQANLPATGEGDARLVDPPMYHAFLPRPLLGQETINVQLRLRPNVDFTIGHCRNCEFDCRSCSITRGIHFGVVKFIRHVACGVYVKDGGAALSIAISLQHPNQSAPVTIR